MGKNEVHNPNFCFHSDISLAYAQYRGYKEEVNRLINTFGPQAKHAITSPFVDAAMSHRQKAENGERYWDSPEEVDQYYLEKMQVAAVRYLAEHPDDPKPNTKPHSRHKSNKHWSEGLYE